MSNFINSKWKLNFEKRPSKAVASTVRLYDLYYNEEAEVKAENGYIDINGLVPWVQDNEVKGGAALEHDVICLYKSDGTQGVGCYQSDGSVVSDLLTSDWINTVNQDESILGIYTVTASHSKHDDMAMSLGVTVDGADVALYPKSSFISYTDNKSFIKESFTYTPDQEQSVTNFPIVSTTYSTAAQVFLTGPEPTFKTTYSLPDTFDAYTRVCISSSFFETICKKLYDSSSNFLEPSTINIECESSPKILPGYTISDSKQKNVNNYAWLLKNTYVVIKAPFFGDYINSGSFNQDLNQKSQVIHNELMLSESGDYNKFNGYEQTPYIPQTSPTIDSMVPKLGVDLDPENSNLIRIDSNGDLPVALNNLIDSVAFDQSEWKGLPVESTLTPPNYFNSSQQYTSWSDTLPAILPRYGNAYIGGRIMSPTIDEIWYMLKKIVAGRTSDIRDNDENSYLTSPLGKGNKRTNEKDSTLVESSSTQSEFTFTVRDKEGNDVTVKGDPLRIDYNKENGVATIKKFINQNDTIRYSVYKELIDIAKQVKAEGQDNRNKIFDFFMSPEELEELGEDLTKEYNKPISDQESFTLSENSKHKYYDVNEGADSEFAPRSAPMSLRELESLGKGNKLNIELLAKYIYWYLENYVPSVGDREAAHRAGTFTNNYHGGINQFHKNFAPNSAAPLNGAFDRDGSFEEITGIKGVPARFDDSSNIHEQIANIAEGVQTYPDENKYGDGNTLATRQEQYSSKQVFMAADGQWRYLFENVRLPILDSTY